MRGSGPAGDDVIGMGSDKPPRRSLAVGRRARFLLAAVGVAALLAVVAVFAVSRVTARTPAQQALDKLVTQVTTVPLGTVASASAAVNNGGYYFESSSSSSTSAYSSDLSMDISEPGPISGPPLTAGGKPEVLYVETGYCPYCVAETWSLIVALSRFGSFSGLRTSHSPLLAGISRIDGWTFYGSSYSSRYLSFVPVETYSSKLRNANADPEQETGYRPLQKLTPAQQAIVSTYAGGQATPFFDFGGQAVMLGATVSPPALAGLTWNQIAADLRRPKTAAGLSIISGAGVLTSEFCQLTDNRPAAACAH